MRDPSGAVAGRIFAFRDVSSEHAVEQMKSDFVSTVSVELRTPLTSIYGFAQTLLRRGRRVRGAGAADVPRVHRARVRAAHGDRRRPPERRAARRRRPHVSLESTDVGSVVEAALAGAASHANGHPLVAEVDGELAAHADPDKLRQVLDQLVSNAVKYSPDGGAVVVTARKLDDMVEVAVVDEGTGVPISRARTDLLEVLQGRRRAGRGTGLGLFIAQGLVREMGGRIWVDSEEGQGSRFAFVLPLAEEQVRFSPVRDKQPQ